MNKLSLSLRIKPDKDDRLMGVWINVSSDDFMATTDGYFYPEDFADFGKALQDFPKNLEQTESLEYGNPSDKFLLRAFVMDARGRCALEVKMKRAVHKDSLTDGYDCHFFLLAEAGDLNRLGAKLVAWSQGAFEPVEFSWISPSN